jgi:hypothetical protein
MMRTLGLLFTLLLAGCGEEVMREDDIFARRLIDEHFSQGASFENVRAVFNEYGRSIDLFRECDSDFERCPYMAIGVVPAPGAHWWLEKGDIQIYLTFNRNKELTGQFYEIYYPVHHR